MLARAATETQHVGMEDRFLRSELLRAVTSVCFNLAEGAAEFSAGDKRRFYRMSRRSAGEAAAIVDALEALGHVTPETAFELKGTLDRVSAMLARLIRRSGNGRGNK